MEPKIRYLLTNLLEELKQRTLNKRLKWKFNFSYTDELRLIESYSSEIKINDKVLGIQLTKTLNQDIVYYNIILDGLDFSGYLESKLITDVKLLIDLIEKNDCISRYPSTVLKLIEFSLGDNVILNGIKRDHIKYNTDINDNNFNQKSNKEPKENIFIHFL